VFSSPFGVEFGLIYLDVVQQIIVRIVWYIATYCTITTFSGHPMTGLRVQSVVRGYWPLCWPLCKAGPPATRFPQVAT
jgi:hypothetical protein